VALIATTRPRASSHTVATRARLRAVGAAERRWTAAAGCTEMAPYDRSAWVGEPWISRFGSRQTSGSRVPT
jgi:hypothetical protein